MAYSVLTLEGFARLFGTTTSEISQECRKLIETHDFRYRPLTGDERDHVLLDVLKRIDSGQFSLAGPEGKERWEKGWAENLDSFLRRGRDTTQLVPKYIRSGQPLRMDQSYVEVADPNFELNWYEVFRLWLFQTYLADVGTVYEFGCGSGFNLAALAKLYPEKRYYGLDWAPPSVDIVNELAKVYGWNMKGHIFDFFAPDCSLDFGPQDAVLTACALEQVGREHSRFLDFVLTKSPALCVHIEPLVELYDPNNLFDYLATRYHRTRGYLDGFLTRLRELETQGMVEILLVQRTYFGSLFHEAYSFVVWRPRIRVSRI